MSTLGDLCEELWGYDFWIQVQQEECENSVVTWLPASWHKAILFFVIALKIAYSVTIGKISGDLGGKNPKEQKKDERNLKHLELGGSLNLSFCSETNGKTVLKKKKK